MSPEVAGKALSVVACVQGLDCPTDLYIDARADEVEAQGGTYSGPVAVEVIFVCCLKQGRL
jgi:hypothetical protein